jgi:hypothetical protein
MQAPIQLEQIGDTLIDATAIDYVGLFASDDGFVYQVDDAGEKKRLAPTTDDILQVFASRSISSVTYNLDGTVDVITMSDGWILSHFYNNGLLASIVETKGGQPTYTTTIIRNASQQIISSTRVQS